MKYSKAMRDILRKAREKITSGLWGRYGFWRNGQTPPIPTKGALEAVPGLSIGSTSSTEPLARFSGYGHDVIANADYTTLAVNHMNELLDDLDELEEENEILRGIIKRMKDGNPAS